MRRFLVTDDRFDAQLMALPADSSHPLGLPQELATHLTQHKRRPRQADLTRPPQAWVEYRLLARLALSGWSLRWSLFEAEARVRQVQPDCGTFKRSARQLNHSELWQTEVVRTVGTYALVRLTEKARTILSTLGLSPVESEWERLDRLHRGGSADQSKHIAAVCAFVHHARRYGYETEVCPQLEDATAEPDILLRKNEHRCYVEVQRRGGDAWKRAAKWSNLMRLQGYVAVCAMTPQARSRMIRELRRCGIQHYVATDLQTLHRSETESLWQVASRSLHSLADGRWQMADGRWQAASGGQQAA